MASSKNCTTCDAEFRCYRIIQQDAARFPADELAVESLADNQLTLHDLVEKVQSATQRPVLHGEETGWSVDLTEADRALGEAVNLRDARLLRRCVQLLKRLLTREPSRNERAAQPHSGDAASGTNRKRPRRDRPEAGRRTDRGGAGQRASRPVRPGRAGVGPSPRQPGPAVASHSHWQSLDVEPQSGRCTVPGSNLIFTWPDVRGLCAGLRGDNSTNWAADLGREEESLDKALNAENPTLVRRHFYRFRRQARAALLYRRWRTERMCGRLSSTVRATRFCAAAAGGKAMTNHFEGTMTIRYANLGEFRSAHTELLRRRRREEEQAVFWQEVSLVSLLRAVLAAQY